MDSTVTYGEEYYKRDEFCFTNSNRCDHNRILELCCFRNTDRILDVGCGYGVLLNRIPSSCKTGIESNEYAINICRRIGLDVVLQGDIEDRLHFDSNQFDYVILNELLEHLNRPRNVVAEAHRVLKSQGRVVITSPARSHFVSDLDPTHFSEMTVRELRTLVESCNFKVLVHEVCGISIIDFLIRRVVYPIGRKIRKYSPGQQNLLVDAVQSGFRTSILLKPLMIFRRRCMWLGAVQLLVAQK